MKLSFLIPVLLLLFLSSCKKEDKNNSNCGKTLAAISGSYFLIKSETASTNNGHYEEQPVVACMRDDKLILNANGTTQYMDLGVSCHQDIITGNWSISSDNKITINAGPPLGTITNGDITSFDCSTLVIVMNVSSQQVLRLTLKRL